MNHLVRQVNEKFKEQFETEPVLVQAPGRVNLIGEHTDYNQGFVLPAAVDKSIILGMQLNDSNRIRFYALDKEEYFETELSADIEKSPKGWPNYLLGVIDQLQSHGYNTSGFDCAFGGNVPIGAGMSSSAALEGGVLFGLDQLLDLDIEATEMARIAQKAENDFVGVRCGIMDQFVSLNGREGYALKLDCRSLEHEFFPFQRDDVHIVLCDTGVRRELASSEYNVRRRQCEQGVEMLQEFDSDIDSLRDVELDFLMMHKDELDSTVFKRCKYVIEENKRVLQACRDLDNGDFYSFGQRMYQSHLGLRYEYEVSCEELDVLVDAAWNMEGVLGSRMMGGGFGGCTINLVKEEYLDEFEEEISIEYSEQANMDLKIYKTRVSAGTHLLNQAEAPVNG